MSSIYSQYPKVVSNLNIFEVITEKLRKFEFYAPAYFIHRLIEGDPRAFMTIYLHIFFDYDRELSNEIGKKLKPHLFDLNTKQNKTSQNAKKPLINSITVQVIYTILKDIFRYKPVISPNQFIDEHLYDQERISMLLEILNLCERKKSWGKFEKKK